jgi:UDP-glucose 4-epimerase
MPARLVHAAVSGKAPALEGVFGGHADDAADQTYIKDTARAIALLQTAKELPEGVYNVGTGSAITNAEVAEAVSKAVPGFTVDLPPGRWQGPPMPVADTERLRRDTGFAPRFDIESAVRAYVEWLRAGNSR